VKRVALIVLCLTALAWAWQPFRIPSPGATGQNTSLDVQELRLTDAKYLLNMNVSRTLGMLVKRDGVHSIGTQIDTLFGVYGYFNSEQRSKRLIGIAHGFDTINIGDAGSVRRKETLDASWINKLRWSKECGFAPDTMVVGSRWLFPLTRGDYDFCKWRDHLIISDGRNVPLVFWSFKDDITTGNTYLNTIRTLHMDKSVYPSSQPMCYLAPGQLGVTEINRPFALTNNVAKYRYRYYLGNTTTRSRSSIESMPIKLRGNTIVLSGFECKPCRVADKDTTWVLIERWLESDGEWRKLDSLHFANTSTYDIFYIDTIVNTTTALTTIWDLAKWSVPASDTIPQPGTIWAFNDASDSLIVDSTSLDGASHLNPDDTVWFAISYYDVWSGQESPLGPLSRRTIAARTIGTDTFGVLMHKGLTVGGRKRLIRVYRSYVGDSTSVFGYVNVSADYLHPSPGTTERPYRRYTVDGGVLDDGDLGGLAECGKIYTATYTGQESNWRFSDGGTVMVRPPYIQQCQMPFVDVEVFASRLWGVGDPMYPQRLYYSEPDQIYEWSPLNYLSLDEDDNDEAIALLRGQSDKGLFAFKHNKTYLVSGYDPEYDLEMNLINDRVGTVNHATVTNWGERVFTFGSDLRLYEVTAGFKEISEPIRNDIENAFVSYRAALDHARLFTFDDDLLLVYYDAGVKEECFAFDLLSNSWSVREYPDWCTPVQSFSYDTSSGTMGFSKYWNWALPGSGKELVKRFTATETSLGYDSIGTRTVSIASYQTPFIGDGNQQWAIMDVQITASATSGSWLIGQIINSRNQTLATDSIKFGSGSDYRLGFPNHVDKYLSVKLTTSIDCEYIKLGEVVLHATPIGSVSLR